ncbi:PA0069 family radical SAM protein [Roseiterribacter gracilis]|uniref:Radical SAM protein n=1 Tax=Roseiterribacter gracilis TaxID=2812848 RepID=A0A8S8X871_9PROT|nr:radical SAM protein [Rhodospirillales bacterium TMPK1]
MPDRTQLHPGLAAKVRQHLDTLPAQATKGRGAVTNGKSGRFELQQAVSVDDGWMDGRDDEEDSPLTTVLGIDTARKVISYNSSPDIGFDRSVNPFKGCEHGCIYCFARPTHAYLNLSPGLDFETRLFHKPDAPDRLRAELSARGYKPMPITLGINTDAYQPIERKLELTRRLLEVLWEFRHPVTILTKSALVTRDLDILSQMARENLAAIGLSITTLDPALARSMEPRAATPPKRIAAIRQAAEAGVPVMVMSAPVIPGLTCHELEAILEAAREAGATRAGMTLVRLPYEIKDLFQEWLTAHAPDRAARVLSLIRQCRDGKLNDPEFGTRMAGTGPVAEAIQARFRLAVKRLGLDTPRRALDCSKFRVPTAQLSFL